MNKSVFPRTTVSTPKGLLITGTDTSAGKTMFCSALLHAVHSSLQISTAGFKPVASGLEHNHAGQLNNPDLEYLKQASSVSLNPELMCPYQFSTACAPHMAAELDNMVIQENVIIDAADKVFANADFVAIEGAGGFMVPLRMPTAAHRNDGYGLDDLFATLSKRYSIGAVVVVGMRLGCINHAQLTVQALQKRNIPIAGWVANCLYSQGAFVQGNIETLEKLLPCERLATLPYIREGQSERNTIEQAATHLNANLILQRVRRAMSEYSMQPQPM